MVRASFSLAILPVKFTIALHLVLTPFSKMTGPSSGYHIIRIFESETQKHIYKLVSLTLIPK